MPTKARMIGRNLGQRPGKDIVVKEKNDKHVECSVVEAAPDYLEKIYIEAGQWLRMVNTIGWAMASIFVPISFTAVAFAVQYSKAKWVFCFGSIFLFTFWVAVSFIYRKTSNVTRDVLMDIERKWGVDDEVSLYVKQRFMRGWFSGVAILQVISLALLIVVWILIFYFNPTAV
jgi:hypothetical protein